jgi:hypothetical protein
MTKVPPQFGHLPPSFVFEHSVQNVHSKEQIIAPGTSGFKSLLQHSQFGLSSSIQLLNPS